MTTIIVEVHIQPSRDILVKTWMNNDQVGLALHYIQQENQQEAWNLDFSPDSVSIGIPLIMHS